MTFRTLITTTAIAASILISAPAFTADHAEGHSGDHMKNKAKVTAEAMMDSPAAKAPLQQQKAEDLMERAEKQMDAGMDDAAIDTAVDAIQMEMKAEANVDKAEAMTGETLMLKTTGETGAPIKGESATVLVNVNPQTVTKVISPAPSAAMSMSIACPAGTTAQPDNTCMITGDYKK